MSNLNVFFYFEISVWLFLSNKANQKEGLNMNLAAKMDGDCKLAATLINEEL